MTLLSLFVFATSTIVTPPALSPPAACASAPAQVEQAAAQSGGLNKALCTADCGPLNSPVSCSGNTCTAVNQSQTCPGGPGYVICDNQPAIYCTPCCTEGQFRSIITGPNCSCEDGQRTPRDRYQCVGGLWEYLESFCGGPFCQGL